MATVGQTGVVSGFAERPRRLEEERQVEKGSGYILFLGGAAFAASYVVLGSTEFGPWAAFLAIAGSALVILGIRSSFHRSA